VSSKQQGAGKMTPDEEKEFADRITKSQAGKIPLRTDGEDPTVADMGDGGPGGEPVQTAGDDAPERPANPPATPPVRRKLSPAEEAERAANAAVALVVRQAYGAFIRSMPADARDHGVHEPKPSGPLAGAYEVPDGVYRIDGYDWRMTFKKKRLVLIERCRPDMSGSGVIRVPTQ